MNLANLIDHTNLKPDATEDEITRLCDEARRNLFYSVCVLPARVPLATRLLAESKSIVCAVAGFPTGGQFTASKMDVAIRSAMAGAKEIDVVANTGWLKDRAFTQYEKELSDIRSHLPRDIGLKVIIETALLTNDEILTATKIVMNCGAQFVKTSTGFYGGVTVDAVKLISKIADNNVGIKASGGIKSSSFCQKLIAAGATRIGSSSSTSIIKEL